jgi:monoamine oxidase
MGDDLSAYYRDENGLVFVGSEYSREFASYMEGAVRSARAKVQAEIRKKI